MSTHGEHNVHDDVMDDDHESAASSGAETEDAFEEHQDHAAEGAAQGGKGRVE